MSKQYAIAFYGFCLLLALTLTSCGYTSVNNVAVVQIKSLHNETPLLCFNYNWLDASLGVMRNGTGSVSTEDIRFQIMNENQREILQEAADAGKLARVTFRDRRFVFCTYSREITNVEIVE